MQMFDTIFGFPFAFAAMMVMVVVVLVVMIVQSLPYVFGGIVRVLIVSYTEFTEHQIITR